MIFSAFYYYIIVYPVYQRFFSRTGEFSVLTEGRSHERVTIKTWEKPETALEKSLAPRVIIVIPYLSLQ